MIDILITSASRPECMKKSMESFLKYIQYSGEFRWILHEDVVLKKESREILEWAEKTALFTVIKKTEPAKRLSNAVYEVLQESKNKYALKLEDDWIFIDYVDIDYMVDVMEKNPEINQLYFNKNMTASQVIFKNGLPVIVGYRNNPHEWAMAPGLWRIGYIKPRWTRDTFAYGVIMKEIVEDYLYGKNLKRANIEHIGEVSTSLLPIDR